MQSVALPGNHFGLTKELKIGCGRSVKTVWRLKILMGMLQAVIGFGGLPLGVDMGSGFRLHLSIHSCWSVALLTVGFLLRRCAGSGIAKQID